MNIDVAEAEPVSVADVAGILAEDIALGQLRPRERLVEDDLIYPFPRKAAYNSPGLGPP